MNKLVLMTSSIQVREGKFSYSETRSKFDTAERLRQTVGSINSIQASLPDAKIVILDSSDEYDESRKIFGYFNNVEFIPLKELSPEAFDLSNSHINKSMCEAIIIQAYYNNYKNRIKEFDFLIKTCGRYLYFGVSDSQFNTQNKDNIFFKKPLQFEWSDSWYYNFVDRRTIQNNNKLHQYCTVMYAYGISNLNRFIDMNEATIHLLNRRNMAHYDIETLMYYYTRPFEPSIIETDWRVCGWDGTSGRFMYY